MTASVRHRRSGGSEVIVDVEPRELEDDVPLDFGRGHRIAASIERDLRLGVPRVHPSARSGSAAP